MMDNMNPYPADPVPIANKMEFIVLSAMDRFSRDPLINHIRMIQQKLPIEIALCDDLRPLLLHFA
jgi:hypothetical protein